MLNKDIYKKNQCKYRRFKKIGSCSLFWTSAEKGLMRSGIPSPGKELRIEAGRWRVGAAKMQHGEATVAE